MEVVLLAVGYGVETFKLWLREVLHVHLYHDSHTNAFFELTGQTCRCGALRWRRQIGYSENQAIFGAWQYGQLPDDIYEDTNI